MGNLKLPFCPYCKARLWYAEAFLSKNRNSYKCKCCSKSGKVEVDTGIFKFLGLVEILSVIIFALSMFAGGSYCFYGLLLILALFGCFYFISPYKITITEAEDDFIDHDENSHDSAHTERFGKDTDTEIYSN